MTAAAAPPWAAGGGRSELWLGVPNVFFGVSRRILKVIRDPFVRVCVDCIRQLGTGGTD